MTDINDTYKMMMTMVMMMIMIRMMKTQNGHNLANYEDTTSRFYMSIDLNLRDDDYNDEDENPNSHKSTNFEGTVGDTEFATFPNCSFSVIAQLESFSSLLGW